MKKRNLLIALCLILALCSMLIFASCNDDTESSSSSSESSSESSTESSSESSPCAHTWGEWTQTTAPTCSKEGQRSRTCSLCSKSESEAVAKLAHTYEKGAWAWSADNKIAKLTFVCSANSEHTTEVSATISESVTTGATCVASGVKTIVATLEFGGATYTDTKTDVIPATGEHKYQNDGKCSACEAICQHDFETKRLSLESVGACSGFIKYTECKTCKMQGFDSECLAYSCNVQMSGGLSQESTTCPVCNASFEFKTAITIDGCKIAYDTTLTIKKGDTVILNGAKEHYEYYEHDETAVLVDFREYSNCFPYLKYEKCEKCDYTELENFQGFCNGGAVPVASKTTIDGVEHKITTVDCDDCTLKTVVDVWETKDSCIGIIHTNVKIYNNDELLYDLTNASENYSQHHELEETTYLVQGAQSCADGRIYIDKCKNCDYESAGLAYSHPDSELVDGVGVDVSGFAGICECEIYLICCTLCDDYTDYEIFTDCDTTTQKNNTTDPETGKITSTETMTCSRCDLVVLTEQVREFIDNCTVKITNTKKITYGQEVIYNAVTFDEDSDHGGVKYELTLLEGKTSCEDGILVKVGCTECDYSFETVDKGHYAYNTKEYKLSDYETGLTGSAMTRSCACGENVIASIPSSAMAQFTMVPSSEVIDGVSRMTMTYTSPEGKVVITVVLEQYKKGCVSYNDVTVTVTVDGEVIIDKADGGSGSTNSHKKSTLATKLVGRTCYDGIYIFSGCDNCDYFTAEERNWCEQETLYELDPDAEGVCSDHEFSFSSCPCGSNYSLSYDNYNLTPSYVENGVCYACDLCDYKVVMTEAEVKNGCTTTKSSTIKMLVGESEKFSISKSDTYDSHTYTVTSSKENGKVAIKNTCSVCSLVVTQKVDILKVTQQADGEYYAIYTFVPTKSGTYTLLSATREYDTKATLYIVGDGGELTTYVDDDDDSAYSNNFALTAELEAGKTYAYIVSQYNESAEVTIPVVLVDSDYTECDTCGNNDKSIFVYLTNEQSCEAGVLAISYCEKCSFITATEDINEHKTGMSTTRYPIDSNTYCGGEIVVNSCACGEVAEVLLDINCSTITDETLREEGGKTIYVRTTTCSNCDIEIKYEYIYEEKGCLTYEKGTYTISGKEGESLTPQINVNFVAFQDHEWESTYTLNYPDGTCRDGVHEERVCTICQAKESNDIYYHAPCKVIISNETVTQSICDGHNFKVVSCLCGQEIEYQRDDGLLYPSDADSDVYICDGCDIKFSVKSVDADDSQCISDIKVSIVIMHGDSELYNVTYDDYYTEYHTYESTQKAGESSVMVTTCTSCGDSFETTIYKGELLESQVDSDTMYLYELVFTPTVSGYYTAYAYEDYDTFGYLIGPDGQMITSDDDSGVGSNFEIVYYLEAGQSYKFIAHEYSGGIENSDGKIELAIVNREMSSSDCKNIGTSSITIDGVEYQCCSCCGLIQGKVNNN